MKSNLKLLLLAALIPFVSGCESRKSEHDKMLEFARKYTAAWNSKKPERMAEFYAEDGTLIVNNGTPATGRKQLAETAASYMEAFPDMELILDSLVPDSGTYRYHWTFIGTNTGPEGTGNKVNFSGFERWTMNDQGLVQKSIGTYDANQYERQLNAK